MLTVFLIMFIATGALFIGLAIPLIRRKIGPNWFYGVRLPATLADEDVWYEQNARSGWHLFWFGCALIVLAVVLPLFGMSTSDYAMTWCAVAVVGAVILGIAAWLGANRLLREKQAGVGRWFHQDDTHTR